MCFLTSEACKGFKGFKATVKLMLNLRVNIYVLEG